MANLNKLYVKAIFSEDSTLNIVSQDMGGQQIKLTLDTPIVTRIPAAVGSVASLNPTCDATISISILKTASVADSYLKRGLENGYIGGNVTLYDDVNRVWTIYDPSIEQAEFPQSDGSDNQVTIIIKGYSYVNSKSLVGA